MTHPRNAPPAGVSRAGADAEKAAFLRDLRALRDHAGLGARDLAARAHFPEDTLTTAEAGPALPSLPVLQAYVRGCGAGEAEWEDRWRRLNQESVSDGSSALPTRAPATARPPSRLMPFPEPAGGRDATEQEAIGFGLARVARGLAPIDSDPASSDGSDGAGWFDPAPRPSASPSMFDPAPSSPSSSPPPPAPTPPTRRWARERRPCSTRRCPATGHQSPATGRRTLATGRRSPPSRGPTPRRRRTSRRRSSARRSPSRPAPPRPPGPARPCLAWARPPRLRLRPPHRPRWLLRRRRLPQVLRVLRGPRSLRACPRRTPPRPHRDGGSPLRSSPRSSRC